MAWTAPITFVAGNVLTAAQMNLIRDNLLETAPAKATTRGRFIVTNGPNAVVERVINDDSVSTAQVGTSSSYDDLATAGPAVTVTSGTSAMVFWSAQMSSAAAGAAGYVSVEVSGATSIAASDAIALIYEVSAANDTARGSMTAHFTNLTAGSNTFTLKYKSGSGAPITFQRRALWVFPQ